MSWTRGPGPSPRVRRHRDLAVGRRVPLRTSAQEVPRAERRGGVGGSGKGRGLRVPGWVLDSVFYRRPSKQCTGETRKARGLEAPWAHVHRSQSPTGIFPGATRRRRPPAPTPSAPYPGRPLTLSRRFSSTAGKTHPNDEAAAASVVSLARTATQPVPSIVHG